MAGDRPEFNAALDSFRAVPSAELSVLHLPSVKHTVYLSYCFIFLIARSYLYLIQGDSVLHVLCKQGWVDTASAFLKKGADVNVINKVILHTLDLFATLYYSSCDVFRRENSQSKWPENPIAWIWIPY